MRFYPPRTLPTLLAAGTFLLAAGVAAAQEPFDPAAAPARVDRADGTVRAAVERAREYLASGEWGEAVDALSALMETAGERLLPVSEWRFVPVSHYAQLLLATMPPEGLAVYRERIDRLARSRYDEASAQRDWPLLQTIVDEMFASSVGDRALLALGERALLDGRLATARDHWERIIPAEPPADQPVSYLVYPDTDLDLAAVRARLVLVSILEGSAERAREELTAFTALHGDARGRLGGRDVVYADALAALLAERLTWPAAPTEGRDWPTFAGSPARNHLAGQSLDPGRVAWRVRLDADRFSRESRPEERTWAAAAGERPRGGLSHFPVVSQDLVLYAGSTELFALDRLSGEPPWGLRTPSFHSRLGPTGLVWQASSRETVGVPRYTLTVEGDRLFARLGAPPARQSDRVTDAVAAFDLGAEGRLLWTVEPDEPGWSFDGTPLADSERLYVAMRRSDVRSQAHVACFDAESGQLLWRRFVAAAATTAGETTFEHTHNLLTLVGDTLYFNTNMGALAALSTVDGRLRWVTLYPRERRGLRNRSGGLPPRDLTPCLFHHGALFVAPADSRRIFALDAASGQVLWHSGPEVQGAADLLGVVDGHLIAAGDRVYWIALRGERRGRVEHVWPDGPEPRGFGRGVIAGGDVFWPTRETIYVFDAAEARLRRAIPLQPLELEGGNLAVAGGLLLVAGRRELAALGSVGLPPVDSREPLAAAGPRP